MTTLRHALIAVCLVLTTSIATAATFNGSSRADATDSTSGLSWNDAAGQKALTITCWFKISLPNGGTISNPMITMATHQQPVERQHLHQQPRLRPLP